jgi:hypothetical protein
MLPLTVTPADAEDEPLADAPDVTAEVPPPPDPDAPPPGLEDPLLEPAGDDGVDAVEAMPFAASCLPTSDWAVE